MYKHALEEPSVKTPIKNLEEAAFQPETMKKCWERVRSENEFPA
jgi:hypothetical protein